ncbi:MAG: ferritin-like domain-containing protein [Syntrophobacteraceae bacterium]|jgi:rubrerythrin
MALTGAEMADRLNSLVQVDIDAVHAYRQVMPLMGPGRVKDQLIRFQQDHERHIDQLSAVVRALDSEPPVLVTDVEGLHIQGFAAIGGATKPQSATEAVRAVEELANRLYRESCALDFTPNIKELVRRNYGEEQRHLRYLEEVFFK